MKNISIIVSSEGKNLELAQKLVDISKEIDFNAKLINLVDLELPLYSPREEKKGIPSKAVKLAKDLQESDSLIFVAPEYNGSVPPVFNNAIAWVSRSSEDWRASFNNKIAAIATHSGGGGAHVLISMRQQLSYIGVNVLGRQLQTNYSKELNIDSAKSIINELISLGNS